MAVRPQKRRTSKKSSVIPVLFTLGIIGWGFFVLDRVVPSDKASKPNNEVFYNKKTKKSVRTQEGWKQTLSGWVNSLFGTTDSVKPKKGAVKVRKSNLEIKENDPHDKGHGLSINKKVSIYLYQELGSGLRLVAIKRKVTAMTDLSLVKKTLQLTINMGKKNSRYLDSFPLTPQILSVALDGNTLIINFNSSFGQGVSLQLLRYQLKQLVKTATQFSLVSFIHLKIKGRSIKYLGGDGIVLPKKINQRNII